MPFSCNLQWPRELGVLQLKKTPVKRQNTNSEDILIIFITRALQKLTMQKNAGMTHNTTKYLKTNGKDNGSGYFMGTIKRGRRDAQAHV